jgi:hypothetical protein
MPTFAAVLGATLLGALFAQASGCQSQSEGGAGQPCRCSASAYVCTEFFIYANLTCDPGLFCNSPDPASSVGYGSGEICGGTPASGNPAAPQPVETRSTFP